MKKKPPSPLRLARMRAAAALGARPDPVPPEAQEDAKRDAQRQRLDAPADLPPPVVMRKPVRFGPRRAA